MRDDIRIEKSLLQNWKLKLALLTIIISPAITATGAYYNLKAEMSAQVVKAQDQIDTKYVRKEDMQSIREDLHDVKTDVRDLKTFLMRKPQ